MKTEEYIRNSIARKVEVLCEDFDKEVQAKDEFKELLSNTKIIKDKIKNIDIDIIKNELKKVSKKNIEELNQLKKDEYKKFVNKILKNEESEEKKEQLKVLKNRYLKNICQCDEKKPKKYTIFDFENEIEKYIKEDEVNLKKFEGIKNKYTKIKEILFGISKFIEKYDKLYREIIKYYIDQNPFVSLFSAMIFLGALIFTGYHFFTTPNFFPELANLKISFMFISVFFILFALVFAIFTVFVYSSKQILENQKIINGKMILWVFPTVLSLLFFLSSSMLFSYFGKSNHSSLIHSGLFILFVIIFPLLIVKYLLKSSSKNLITYFFYWFYCFLSFCIFYFLVSFSDYGIQWNGIYWGLAIPILGYVFIQFCLSDYIVTDNFKILLLATFFNSCLFIFVITKASLRILNLGYYSVDKIYIKKDAYLNLPKELKEAKKTDALNDNATSIEKHNDYYVLHNLNVLSSVGDIYYIELNGGKDFRLKKSHIVNPLEVKIYNSDFGVYKYHCIKDSIQIKKSECKDDLNFNQIDRFADKIWQEDEDLFFNVGIYCSETKNHCFIKNKDNNEEVLFVKDKCHKALKTKIQKKDK